MGLCESSVRPTRRTSKTLTMSPFPMTFTSNEYGSASSRTLSGLEQKGQENMKQQQQGLLLHKNVTMSKIVVAAMTRGALGKCHPPGKAEAHSFDTSSAF